MTGVWEQSPQPLVARGSGGGAGQFLQFFYKNSTLLRMFWPI